MALLGAYGALIFECSRRRVHTFSDLTVSDSARFAQHDVHLQAPILEFCGPGLSEVSFTMNFNTMWNADPHISLVILRRYSKTGIVAPLLVGGKPLVIYSPNLWVLTSLGETHKWFTRDGILMGASADVSLKEYRLLI
jgi:hypothetical protein